MALYYKKHGLPDLTGMHFGRSALGSLTAGAVFLWLGFTDHTLARVVPFFAAAVFLLLGAGCLWIRIKFRDHIGPPRN